MEQLAGLLNILLVTGAFNGVLIVIFLFTRKKGHHKANRMLAALILSFLFSMVNYTVFDHLTIYIPFNRKLGEPFQLFFGPFLYFYVNYLANPQFRFNKKHLWHFLPFVFAVSIAYPVYTRVFILNDHSLTIINFLAWIVILLHVWCYLIMIHRLIGKHKKDITNEFSNLMHINLSWITFFTLAMGLSYIIYIISIPILFHGPAASPQYNKLVITVLAVIINGIGFKGLTQPEIFSGISSVTGEITRTITADQDTKVKYEKSLLSKDEIESGLLIIQQAMEQKKVCCSMIPLLLL